MNYRKQAMEQATVRLHESFAGITVQGPVTVKALEPGSSVSVSANDILQIVYTDPMIVLVIPFPEEEK